MARLVFHEHLTAVMSVHPVALRDLYRRIAHPCIMILSLIATSYMSPHAFSK